MRAVDYRRVSSAMQVEGFSLDAQAAACRTLINQRGWILVGSYADEGISARTTDRPSFAEMMTAARERQFDVIVVHKLDRLSRSVVDLLLIMRELEQLGVAVVSATEQFDFSTPIGRVLLTLIAAIAEWYLANLGEETSKGMQARAAAGLWQGRLPYGYAPEGGVWKRDQGGSGIAVVDEHQREGYELAVSLAETGEYSYRQIAERLNEAGYRPAGRSGRRSLQLWSTDTIRSVLRSRFYLGEISYKGEWLPGAHEPLITEARWQRVQETMAARARIPAFKARRDAKLYILAGLCRCATCGSPMRGEYKTNNKIGDEQQIYQYYRCSAKYRGVSCNAQPYVRAEAIESVVAGQIKAMTFAEGWREQAEARAAAMQQQQQEPEAAKASKVSRRALQSQLERLKDLYKLGDIERPEYLRERDRIQAELAAIPTPKAAEASQRAIIALASFGDVWDIATVQERQALAREIIQRVIVTDAETIEVIPRPLYQPYWG
jgi:site-specific DNA recombinase